MSLKSLYHLKMGSATYQLDDQLCGMGVKIADRAPNGDIPIDVRGMPGGPRRVIGPIKKVKNTSEAEVEYETRH